MKFFDYEIPDKSYYSRAYYALKGKGYDAKGAAEYALQGDHRGVLRYNGTTVRKYCLKNNLSYSKTLEKITRGMSIKDAVESTKYYTERLRRGISANTKYIYNDKPVRHLLSIKGYGRFLRLINRGYTVNKAYKEVKNESDKDM